MVATIAAYAPALGAGWIWDDDAYVTRNLALRSLEGLWRIWMSPGATPQYHPLTPVNQRRFGQALLTTMKIVDAKCGTSLETDTREALQQIGWI